MQFTYTHNTRVPFRHFSKSTSLLTDDENDVSNVTTHKRGAGITTAECTDPKRNKSDVTLQM